MTTRRPDPLALAAAAITEAMWPSRSADLEAHLARALVRRHQRTQRLCATGDHDDEARELVALMLEEGWR